ACPKDTRTGLTEAGYSEGATRDAFRPGCRVGHDLTRAVRYPDTGPTIARPLRRRLAMAAARPAGMGHGPRRSSLRRPVEGLVARGDRRPARPRPRHASTAFSHRPRPTRRAGPALL